MFHKPEVLEENSATNSAPKKDMQKDLFERIKKDKEQFELTDTGVPLKPHRFFSLKEIHKNQVIAQGLLPTEQAEKEISQEEALQKKM